MDQADAAILQGKAGEQIAGQGEAECGEETDSGVAGAVRRETAGGDEQIADGD